MARSFYIYLVFRLNEQQPIGAFTVKHEAIAFYDKLEYPADECWIVRTPDGEYHPTVCWPQEH